MFFKRSRPGAGAPAIQPTVAEAFLGGIRPKKRYPEWHVANGRAALTFPAGSDAARQWLQRQRSGLWMILAEPLTPFRGGAYSDHRLRDTGFCAVRIPHTDGAENRARAYKPAPQGIVATRTHLYLLWRMPGRGGLVSLEAAKACAEHAAKALGGEDIGYKFPLPGTMHDGGFATALRADPAGTSTLTAFEPGPEEEDVAHLGQVQAGETKWVWPGVFPAGFALLGGEAGLRKTQAAISMQACIATGGYWPGDPEGRRAELGCCMIYASEDDVATVLKNRVLAAVSMFVDELIARGDVPARERAKQIDAAVNRFYASNDPIKLPDDQRKIEKHAAGMRRKTGLPVRMLFLDPMRNFYTGSDTSRTVVMEALNPLKDWSVREGIVSIGIRHPVKERNESNAQAMISGSSAEIETARATYFFFQAPTPGAAWMLWTKGNYHAPAEKTGFETIVEDFITPEGFRTSRVRWRAHRINLTANDYLAGEAPGLEPPTGRPGGRRGGDNNGGSSSGGPRLQITGASGEDPTAGQPKAERGDAEAWVKLFLEVGDSIDKAALIRLGATRNPPITRWALSRLRSKGIFDGNETWTRVR